MAADPKQPKGAKAPDKHHGWKPGPLPPDTYGWGGVVPVGEKLGGGFYYADFKGDHVTVYPTDDSEYDLKPDRVAQYNNAIQTLPPADDTEKAEPNGGA
jgi:hypothetical protein